MAMRQFPLIAREGWPFIGAAMLMAIAATRIGGVVLLVPVSTLMILLILLFRDPPRRVPSRPLALISPVDGKVVAIRPTDKGLLEREAMLIEIKINHFGAYTARSPTEGKVLSLRDNLRAGSRLTGISGLWVRTDEGDDVVVLILGKRRIAQARSFVGYGERLGQGQRFASIRLAARVQVFVPLGACMEVKVGQRVKAGTDALAELVHYVDETFDDEDEDKDNPEPDARTAGSGGREASA